MSSEFEIGEYKFQVNNLKVKTSLHVFKKLAKTILPAIAEAKMAGSDKIGDALDRVVENLDSLDDLLDAFVPVTKYTDPARPDSPPIELKAFVEHVFGGHPERLLEYLARCVQGEYGLFLAENGLLAPLLAKAKAAGLA
jgi:tail assembly chaperone